MTWRLISYLRGVDATPATRRELIDAAVLMLVGAVVLALAAWIEATLTRRIARMLVDTPP